MSRASLDYYEQTYFSDHLKKVVELCIRIRLCLSFFFLFSMQNQVPQLMSYKNLFSRDSEKGLKFLIF